MFQELLYRKKDLSQGIKCIDNIARMNQNIYSVYIKIYTLKFPKSVFQSIEPTLEIAPRMVFTSSIKNSEALAIGSGIGMILSAKCGYI